MGLKVSKAGLAEIVGRDERTLSRWQREGMPVQEIGLGRGNENQYDTEEVIGWLVQVAALNGKKESVRDRLDRIKGDREELALAKDLEELVPAALVGARLEQVVLAIRTGVLTGNPKLKTEIDTLYDVDLDIELLNEHSRSILRQLAGLGGQPGAGDRPDSVEVRAATEDQLD